MNTNKMELIKELEYLTNYETLGNKLIQWGKQSNNKDIKLCKTRTTTGWFLIGFKCSVKLV